MIATIRILLSLFLSATVASAQGRVERNIVYGMYSGTALLMDVHYPENAHGVGVIFVPGSGWSADTAYGAEGIKDGEIPRIWVPPLTGAGYTVFVPNHRATPGFHYPDPVHDIQRAVRFVRHNAARFKVDANRLGGLGGSSGGHLIALMGLMDSKAEDDSDDPVDQQGAKLQALVLYSAPVDLSMVPVGASVGAFLRVPPPTPRTPKATARLYQEASPISYVTAEDPPTLLLAGDADTNVPHRHAMALQAALQKVHVPSKLITIPRGTHGPTFGLAAGAARPADWPDYNAEMVGWFDHHLKTMTPPRVAFQQPASRDANVSQERPTAPVVRVQGTIPCEVQGPIVRIPSKSAPDGIQLRLLLPAAARYPEGAPIVVHSTANASIDRVHACLRGQGFVDVVYQCHGGRAPRLTSCSEPLADVLAFATGRIRSLENKSIADYTGDMKVDTANVGLVGWSAGGNRAVLTMAQYGDRFPGLKWYASWESPMLSVGDGGGVGTIYQPNPFYDPSTGTVDLKRLRYSADMPLWVWPPEGPPCAPDCPRGGLYLEGDRNERFTRESDYAYWVLYDSPQVGQPRKAFYSGAVIREARDRQVFGPTWPSHIATPEEVEQRASTEDALRHVPDVVRRLPHLAVMVFESEVGHVTVAPDHPHAIAQVNAWLSARARWVRFQPDAHYLESVMQKRPSRVVQFPAGQGLDRARIASVLQSEAANGGPSDAQGMAAAAAELADRTHRSIWTAELSAVLVK